MIKKGARKAQTIHTYPAPPSAPNPSMPKTPGVVGPNPMEFFCDNLWSGSQAPRSSSYCCQTSAGMGLFRIVSMTACTLGDSRMAWTS